MRPKTKRQKQYAEWAGMLPPLDEKRKEWAKKLFPPQALYYSRRGNNCEFWCQCCGTIVPTLGKWLLVDQVAPWTCPNCGAVCEVLPQYNGGMMGNYNSHTRQRGVNPVTNRYVTLVDIFQGHQVFRTFDVWRWNRRDGNDERGRWKTAPTEYEYYEIYQNWVDEKGAEVITSRSYTRSCGHFSWSYHSDWGVNFHNAHCSGYYVFDDVFEVAGNWIFPRMMVTPMLKRNGFPTRLPAGAVCKYDLAKMAVRLLTDADFEKLTKMGQPAGVAGFFLDKPFEEISRFMNAIRICTKNGYRIKDAGLWIDYIENLVELGKDTHSPKYLCPRNLEKAHERASRAVERIREKKREEERTREARKWEKRYAVAKAPFLGIAFGDDTVQIAVLQSVEAVRREGKAMHHCVFSNGYYKHPDRVLLSAKDMDGNRLETIEIGLDPFKVLQSRGLQNKATKEHKRIVELCEANMDAFRRAVPEMTVPLHLVGKNAHFYQD
ncbi:MAG: PcfJ domain-containing protein [Bacteroidales bacterium]|nr:PcfJ domain-containing protein [Bacteroidales bacterium]